MFSESIEIAQWETAQGMISCRPQLRLSQMRLSGRLAVRSVPGTPVNERNEHVNETVQEGSTVSGRFHWLTVFHCPHCHTAWSQVGIGPVTSRQMTFAEAVRQVVPMITMPTRVPAAGDGVRRDNAGCFC